MEKQAISKASIIAETCRHAFPTIYILSIPYKHDRTKAAVLPSFLFLSPTSSSRLMPLRFVTARATDGFSTGILFPTQVPSPHHSIIIEKKYKSTTLCVAPDVTPYVMMFSPNNPQISLTTDGAGGLGLYCRLKLSSHSGNGRPCTH